MARNKVQVASLWEKAAGSKELASAVTGEGWEHKPRSKESVSKGAWDFDKSLF